MKHSQSLAGYIRQHLAEIEARLEVGIRQEVIVSELENIGYKTTLTGFRNFLYRARIHAKKRGVVLAIRPEIVAKEVGISTNKSTTNETKKPEDKLTKSAGFQYTGTIDIKPEDLI